MMATYSRREVSVTTVEFLIPAPMPWGACWVEVGKAFSAAIQELRDSGELGPDETPSDDRVWVRAGDDELVVSYELKQARAERGAT